MYDQVGGGFHRYSVDERWLVPHFEKMLYDNAMLARVYLIAHRAFGDADFLRVARETLDYLLAEMTPAEGGFFAAQDADSEGKEGVFYVWNPRTLREAVGGDAAPIIAARFGVTERGNFEDGETVLSVVRSIPQLASEFGQTEDQIRALLAGARKKMYEARSRRVPPQTDDKLLTDWSALAISAFALAGRLLREPAYEQAARKAADRILAHCRRDGLLLHRERKGRADIRVRLNYASSRGLWTLHEATFDALFPAGISTSASPTRAEATSFRKARGCPCGRESFDGAPFLQLVAAMNLLRLALHRRSEISSRPNASSPFVGLLDRAPSPAAAALRPRLPVRSLQRSCSPVSRAARTVSSQRIASPG
jgi:hypothetical protein